MVVRKEGGWRVVGGAGGGSSFVVDGGDGFVGEEVTDAGLGRRRTNGRFGSVGSVEEVGAGGCGMGVIETGQGGVVAHERVTRGLRGDG